MKKFYFLFTVILLLVASCEKEEPVLTLSSSSILAPSVGNSTVIQVNSNNPWTASGAEWCVISPSSGNGGGESVTITVKENVAYDTRSCTVVFTSAGLTQQVNVSQQSNDGILLSKDIYVVSSDAQQVSVEIKANVNYSVESGADWIGIGDTKALSSKNTLLDIAENKSAQDREGIVRIKSKDNSIVVDLKVRQTRKGIITLSKGYFNVDFIGDTISFEVGSNIDYGIRMPDVGWVISLSGPAEGKEGTFKYLVCPNTDSDSRSADIVFYEKNGSLEERVTISQGAFRDNGTLSVGECKQDHPAIYSGGGETVLPVFSSGAWKACAVEEESDDWIVLECAGSDKGDGTLHIKSLANNGKSERAADIYISNGKDVRLFRVVQRQNIMRRTALKKRKVTNTLKMSYDAMTLIKMVAVMPVPQSGIYQDISGVEFKDATLMQEQNNSNKYIKRTLLQGEFPASGQSILSESFDVVTYMVTADLDAVTSVVETDEDSELFKENTGECGDLIVPHHPGVEKIAGELWQNSSNNLLKYAYNCYEYVASKMKYLNPNTGLHPIDKILSDGGGDCGNQVSLFVSLLRNRKIPARHVVMIRTDNTYHVRAEFFLAGYGWIPADVNAKNMNPSGDYFGRTTGNEIVVSTGINNDIELNDGEFLTLPLLQTYGVWYWWTSPANLVFSHIVMEN